MDKIYCLQIKPKNNEYFQPYRLKKFNQTP